MINLRRTYNHTARGAGVIMLSLVHYTAVAQTAPSVPNLIAYQGRVSLAGGSPVADGSYPASFTLYNYSSGGASLWNENANVTTSGGTFSHNLGSVSSLPATLSFSSDSLWLAITFNGELLSPRTRIVGNAYSLTANDLEGNNGFGTVSLRASANAHQISQYGSDGGEQMRLWGPSYAELVMDGSAIDNATDDILLSTNGGAGSILRLRKPGGTAGAVLHSGTSGGGGSLTLTNDVGSTTVFMDGDLSSDGAVILPGGSINALEQLNEPGIASDVVTAGVLMTIGWNTLASRTIVAPSDGYVFAIGTCEFLGASDDTMTIGISTATNSLQTSQQFNTISVRSQSTYSVHGVFPVSTGAQTFNLLVDYSSGSATASARSLALLFVPTSYGTVDSPSAPDGSDELSSASDPDHEAVESVTANTIRLERELEQLRAQAMEHAERLRALEAGTGRRSVANDLDNPEN